MQDKIVKKLRFYQKKQPNPNFFISTNTISFKTLSSTILKNHGATSHYNQESDKTYYYIKDIERVSHPLIDDFIIEGLCRTNVLAKSHKLHAERETMTYNKTQCFL
jgi:hypothetical protein